MNDDKPDAIETRCVTCDVAMEYVDGAQRCLCHECGTQWGYRLANASSMYPTKDNPIQEMSIRYDGETRVFPPELRGKTLEE